MTRGLTLAETVVASFILVSAFMVAVVAFDASLERSRSVRGQTRAVLVAEQRLEEIRESALDIGGFQALASNFDGITVNREGLEVTTYVDAHTIDSPSAGLESVFGSPRRMSSSAQKVSIEVPWRADRTYRVSTIIGSPPWQLEGLQVTGDAPSPAALGYTYQFGVVAYAPDQTEIPDLMYRWYVVPITGSVSLASQTRNGATATFSHTEEYKSTQQCQLQVTTVYRGRSYSALSPVIDLADANYVPFSF